MNDKSPYRPRTIYSHTVDVVAEAIRWYGENPQAEASPAEVIASALFTAELIVEPTPNGNANEL